MVFETILQLNSTLLVVGVGIIFSVIMVLLTKYTTDQDLLKRLRDEMKELQAEIKMLQNNPSKAGEVNKRMMDAQMKMMMQSMKPMLFSMIPAFLILGWFNAHIAYMPLVIEEEFSVELNFYDGIAGTIEPMTPEGITLINGEAYAIKDNKVRLVYKGNTPGEYMLQYTLNNDAGEVLKTWEQQVIITASENEKEYTGPAVKIKDDAMLETITISNSKFTPLGSVSIFGWHPGWLALYIFTSLICSIGLRKWLNVY